MKAILHRKDRTKMVFIDYIGHTQTVDTIDIDTKKMKITINKDVFDSIEIHK